MKKFDFYEVGFHDEIGRNVRPPSVKLFKNRDDAEKYREGTVYGVETRHARSEAAIDSIIERHEQYREKYIRQVSESLNARFGVH